MTNNWTDIGNSTLVIVMGANPTENHPASIAHINRARSGPGTYYDRAGNAYTSEKKAATLVVVDPRKTRTAAQADLFVRIRPGTDIAFINGLLNYIIDAGNSGTGLWASANANKRARWQAFHEVVENKTLYDNVGVKAAISRPKYTDAAFKVTAPTATPVDYARTDYTVGANTWAQIPEVAGMSPADNSGAPDMFDPDTVFSTLKAHVAPYTPSVVADICGCSEAELIAVANLIIENSRCSSVASDTDAFGATINDPKTAGYVSTTFMYAMGLTQHTHGSQNVKSFAVLQSLMGNVGRPGGGINALRGIHNVQGSTDMGLLYHLIPGYSGNPNPGETFGAYMNRIYGNKLSGSDGSGVDDPYVFLNGGLQQKGFYSMTKSFFGDSSYRGTWATGYEEDPSAIPDSAANMDALFGLWPRSGGDNHIRMFRKMLPTYAGTDKITACMVWGQNPAVTTMSRITMSRSATSTPSGSAGVVIAAGSKPRESNTSNAGMTAASAPPGNWSNVRSGSGASRAVPPGISFRNRPWFWMSMRPVSAIWNRSSVM